MLKLPNVFSNLFQNKKKGIILIILIVLLSTTVSGAVWFFLFSDQNKSLNVAQQQASLGEIASYIPINEPIIFNVSGGTRERLAQMTIQIQVRGKDNYQLAMDNLAVIESNINTKLRASTEADLKEESGRMSLRRSILESVQAEMEQLTKKTIVEQILFTDFVMQ